MDSSWIQTLQGPQVGKARTQGLFLTRLWLNEREVWALLGMGCGGYVSLVGPGVPHLSLCIHGGVREYHEGGEVRGRGEDIYLPGGGHSPP